MSSQPDSQKPLAPRASLPAAEPISNASADTRVSDLRDIFKDARWLAAIVESSDDAIVSKDLNGVIQSWNQGAERLFGYTSAEAVGRSVTMLIPPGHDNEEPAILERIRRGERVDHYETVRRRKDGSFVDVSLTISPVRDASGKVIGASKVARNVSDRARGDQAARHLAAIVESSDDAIISKDLNGVIQTWNGAAEKLFGYTAAEAIGQPVLLLLPKDRYDEETTILARLRRGERVEHYETIRRRKDGTLFEVSLTVSPMIDRHGRVVGASKIARDISQQRRVLRELSEAHEKALAANRAKDEFLAALSHELRTPLNPVLLLASNAALDETLPSHVRADFEAIRKHVELEARLIDDLLDLSRITNQKLSLTLAEQDLRSIVADAIAITQAELEAKKQMLRVDVGSEALPVWGDAVRLQQVFWNVLKNAVKFTDAGGTIIVNTRVDADRRRVRLEISDTGIGLKPEQITSIFDAFAQGDHGSRFRHRFGGLGLGLTIAQLIIKMHGGTISAVSEGVDRGSTFVVELPLVAAATGQKLSAGANGSAAANGQPSKTAPGSLRILLVEDHEASREALAKLLVHRGHSVSRAATAAEARAIALAEPLSVVISDIGLPDQDGAALIAELRERYRLPAIALTGYGSEADVLRCRAAGAFAHLTKPVTMAALDRVLKDDRILRAAEGTSEVPR